MRGFLKFRFPLITELELREILTPKKFSYVILWEQKEIKALCIYREHRTKRGQNIIEIFRLGTKE